MLTPWEEGGYAVIDPDADGPFAVSKVSVVTDEQSYNQLPQAYLEAYPWDTYKDSILNGENPLPWIAFEVTKEQALEVVANEVATGYSKSLSFPAEVNKIGLLTLSAKELGVEELKGEWIITINDIPKIVNFE